MLKKLLKKHKVTGFQIKVFVLFFLVLYLILNIASSQLLSNTYFNLVSGGKNNAVTFLKQIRGLPIFDQELEKYEDIYGKSLKDDVFSEEIAQNEKIKNFERTLEKNTYSRDILYSLYLLHKEKGEDNLAESYLRQVREIDPTF